MIEHVQFNLSGIDFDRNLRIRIEVEIIPQQRHQTADLRFIQVGWRAAAPVQLANLACGKQRRTMKNFLFQRIQILIGLMLLSGHNLIAATEVAEFVAKRDMNVKRERALRIARDGL